MRFRWPRLAPALQVGDVVSAARRSTCHASFDLDVDARYYLPPNHVNHVHQLGVSLVRHGVYCAPPGCCLRVRARGGSVLSNAVIYAAYAPIPRTCLVDVAWPRAALRPIGRRYAQVGAWLQPRYANTYEGTVHTA